MNEIILRQTMTKGALFIKFMAEVMETPAEELISDFEEWSLENGFAEVVEAEQEEEEEPQELWSMEDVLSELEPPESE